MAIETAVGVSSDFRPSADELEEMLKSLNSVSVTGCINSKRKLIWLVEVVHGKRLTPISTAMMAFFMCMWF